MKWFFNLLFCRYAASLAKELAKVKISSRLTERESDNKSESLEKIKKTSKTSTSKDDSLAPEHPVAERQESRESQHSRSLERRCGESRRNSTSVRLIK
jgi:hypothetical protein